MSLLDFVLTNFLHCGRYPTKDNAGMKLCKKFAVFTIDSDGMLPPFRHFDTSRAI